MEAVAAETGFVPRPRTEPGEPAWLAALRDRGFSRFTELGFPTPKNERWRYTGIQPITGTNWTPTRRPPVLAGAAQPGVRVRRIAEAAADLEPLLSSIARLDAGAFTALNTALFEDGVLVEILPGAVVREPIEIALEASARWPEAVHPRLFVLARERSEASVLESFAGGGRYLTNAVTEILLEPGALLEHTKLQRESDEAAHVHTIAVRQERGSRFTSHNVALGGALARTEIEVTLGAEGAECALNGLFVGGGTQHIDNRTGIDHAAPHGTSRELYKGVMDGGSRGVFHGTIVVRPGAQKTDAIQTNKNLLLSHRAIVNSTPALEIFADDVKCKHGSTTGQLDDRALFYLRSRGIGEADARALLTYAFAADVADRIRIPRVRAAVETALGMRLGRMPSGEARA